MPSAKKVASTTSIFDCAEAKSSAFSGEGNRLGSGVPMATREEAERGSGVPVKEMLQTMIELRNTDPHHFNALVSQLAQQTNLKHNQDLEHELKIQELRTRAAEAEAEAARKRHETAVLENATYQMQHQAQTQQAQMDRDERVQRNERQMQALQNYKPFEPRSKVQHRFGLVVLNDEARVLQGDIGNSNPNAIGHDYLGTIVNSGTNGAKPLLVTGNLSNEMGALFLSSAVGDRFDPGSVNSQLAAQLFEQLQQQQQQVPNRVQTQKPTGRP